MKNKHQKSHFSFFLITLFFLLLASCNTTESNKNSNNNSPPLKRVFHLGGAPVSVTVKLSSSEISLIDYLTLTVTVQTPKGYNTLPPYLTADIYQPFLLVKRPVEKTEWDKTKQDELIQEVSYQLEPAFSGEFQIKPFNIPFQIEAEKPTQPGQEWKIYTIRTEAIPIKVSAIETTTDEQIRPIKNNIQPPYRYIYLLMGLGLISLILGLTFGVKFWWRYQKHRQEIIKIDYQAVALQELDKLVQQNLIQAGLIEELHMQLSKILREYIENQFCMKAQEQTTEEFLQDVSNSMRFTEEQRSFLSEFLRLSDLVKFATFHPTNEKNENAIEMVKKFIQKTCQPELI